MLSNYVWQPFRYTKQILSESQSVAWRGYKLYSVKFYDTSVYRTISTPIINNQLMIYLQV